VFAALLRELCKISCLGNNEAVENDAGGSPLFHECTQSALDVRMALCRGGGEANARDFFDAEATSRAIFP
jgi:hypothetical protein